MAHKLRLALAAAVLGSLALSTTGASAHGIGFGIHGGGIHFGGFHGGWGWRGWGPGFGFRRVGFVRAYAGCYVQRWVTVDGEFIVRRICY